MCAFRPGADDKVQNSNNTNVACEDAISGMSNSIQRTANERTLTLTILLLSIACLSQKNGVLSEVNENVCLL